MEKIRIPQKHSDFFDDICEEEYSKEVVLQKVASYLCSIETLITDQNERDTIETNSEKRILKNYEDAKLLCSAFHKIGHKIVLTSGSFDLFHIGHARYLDRASRYGDILVVGVDSDKKIKDRKGSSRPVVGEEERMSTLSHVRNVDFIVKKELDEEKWGLIKVVNPDILIATEGTYSEESISELESNYVGKVVVLPPQATTSTSARIRIANIKSAESNAASGK